jgi:hypothetical protein
MNKQTIIILFFILLVSNVFPQGSIAVNSTVDRDRILIGDVITYSLIVERDADVEVVMPSLAQNLGMFEIRNYEVLEPQKVDGKTVEQTDYLISTFDTGDYVIPDLEINYRVQGDSSWQVIKTEPIDIFVESLNPDEAGDIRDIKPPLTPPRDYTMLIWMIIFAVLIIAAILFAIYYIKRLREGKSIIPRRSTPPRPAHEIAFEQLNALKKSDLIAQNRIKDFYTEVSDTLRRYIQNRYFILAMEKTTSELLDDMAANGLADEYNETVRSVLTQSDFVKFAKFIPPAEQHDNTWQLAYDYVDATKLIFDPTEETEKTTESDADVIVEDQNIVVEQVEPADENDAPELSSTEQEGKKNV